MIASQALVIVGGVTGVIPLTGITLPLVATWRNFFIDNIFFFFKCIQCNVRREDGIIMRVS